MPKSKGRRFKTISSRKKILSNLWCGGRGRKCTEDQSIESEEVCDRGQPDDSVDDNLADGDVEDVVPDCGVSDAEGVEDVVPDCGVSDAEGVEDVVPDCGVSDAEGVEDVVADCGVSSAGDVENEHSDAGTFGMPSL